MIKDLTELGYEYPLRANVMFNKFEIFDKVNRKIYPPQYSSSLAWKEKQRKLIEYMVCMFNNADMSSGIVQDNVQEPVQQEKKQRGRPRKVS